MINGKSVRFRLVVLLLCAAAVVGDGMFPNAAEAREVAGETGETIEFELRYLGGRGGGITLASGTDVLDGHEVRTTRVRVRTTGTLKEFYSVDDRLTGYFDPTRERSLGYDLRENHGGDRDSESVRYHHDQGYYVENDGPRRSLPAGALDLASALLELRSRPLRERRTMTVQVTGDVYRMLAIPEGVEVLNVNGFRTRAVRIRLRPKDPDAYEEMRSWLTKDAEGIYLWMGQGPRRIPLRIRASTEIGEVEARISDYRRDG